MKRKRLFHASVWAALLGMGAIAPASVQAQSAIDDITLDVNKQSAASQWVTEVLNAVATTPDTGTDTNFIGGAFLGPTAASRAYGLLGTAMYDAWASYEDRPVSTLFADDIINFDLQRPLIENTQANKEEAISYAAFGVLNNIFEDPRLQQSFADRMTNLGFDPLNTSTDVTTAAGIGNFVAQQLMGFRVNDGSNQLNNYADTTGFVPTNTPGNLVDIEKWTRENVPIGSIPGDGNFLREQPSLQPQWGGVTPFALESGDQFRPVAPEPFLLDPNATADFNAGTITRADNTVVTIDASLIGTDINPGFIDQAQQVLDFSASLSQAGEAGVPPGVTADGLPGRKVEGETRKMIAEFWEDPSGTPFPPGTWMLFGQKVLEKDNPVLDDDIQLFFNLGNAVFDAGIATWEAKYFYNYARPVRAIRDLGAFGLIGTDDGSGTFTTFAWGGPEQGTIEIPVTEFLTYQTPGQDPSPPFPEYTSGHSAFSAAAAEVLRLFTGSDDFILGDGTQGLSVSFAPGESRFEPDFTPMDDTTIVLTWDTFSEAADEAGISRLYGGIHFEDGDINGRSVGRNVGREVFARTTFLANGASVPEPGMINALALFGGLFLFGLWTKNSC